MGSPKRRPELFSGVSRRDFLRTGSLSFVGLSMAERAALHAAQEPHQRKSCILILMTGGASQLETFDPKPNARAEIRGPLKAISTATPGLFFSECLPSLAQRTNKFSLIRSMYHDATPIHETGYQLLQTGRLAQNGCRHPSFGSAAAKLLGERVQAPPYVVLPKLIDATGVNTYRGQEAGYLGDQFDPLTLDSTGEKSLDGFFEESKPSLQNQYGDSRFGRLCLQARQLVEQGVRCVTVNLFDNLSDQITWDCHGQRQGAQGTVFDYRDTLGPQFDRALSALLDDLEQRGLLEDTLVVATGEFGRTPKLNDDGGRDHWTRVWSALIAGGGTKPGQLIGASDANGYMPLDRPVHLSELTATIYHTLGLSADIHLPRDAQAKLPLTDRSAVKELFV